LGSFGGSLELSSDGLTIGLVLCSALLHASWNALTKASGDPLVNIAVVTATGSALTLPAVLELPPPGSETWPWLGASCLVHYAYQLSLVRPYQLGDLSQVYPIARGLAPLGVATLAALWAGESLAPGQVLGLALASGAIMMLAGLRSVGPSTRHAVGMALVTATMIGLYTYIDGRGVRSVTRPAIYIGWSFSLGALPIALTTILVRGRAGLTSLRRNGPLALGGGAMATLGYAITLWAMSRTSMASVASLRESSVLFAAVLGTRLLGEPFGRRRTLAASVLVVGLVLVQVRSL
jgi:drug/metabolite transporter (DMT)-like permease